MSERFNHEEGFPAPQPKKEGARGHLTKASHEKVQNVEVATAEDSAENRVEKAVEISQPATEYFETFEGENDVFEELIKLFRENHETLKVATEQHLAVMKSLHDIDAREIELLDEMENTVDRRDALEESEKTDEATRGEVKKLNSSIFELLQQHKGLQKEASLIKKMLVTVERTLLETDLNLESLEKKITSMTAAEEVKASN